MLQNGADVNLVNDVGDTPLHRAAFTGREVCSSAGCQSTRTQYQLVLSQLVPKSTRTQYQLVPKLTCTQFVLILSVSILS